MRRGVAFFYQRGQHLLLFPTDECLPTGPGACFFLSLLRWRGDEWTTVRNGMVVNLKGGFDGLSRRGGGGSHFGMGRDARFLDFCMSRTFIGNRNAKSFDV